MDGFVREAGASVTGMSRQNDFVLKGVPLEGIPDCSLGEYLLPKLRAHPQDIIIQVDGDTGEVQTIGELLAESIRLAEGLCNLGVKETDVVGLMCRNCFEASEVVLGTWLRGAAIAPAPSTMTVGEYKHNLGITKPKVVFCEEEAVNNVTAALNQLSIPAKVILVGNTKNPSSACMKFQEVLAEVDVENYKPRPVKSPSTDLVAILPSSGTSGLPKGVGLTHANLIFQDFNMNVLTFFDVQKTLQISHFFWVTGVLLFLKSLTLGSTRILLRNPTPLNCLKAIDRYKAEGSMGSPLFVLAIASHPDFEKYDTSSMKIFLVGGTAFTQSMNERIKEKWPEIKLLQAYGTTEVSGTILYNNGGDPHSQGVVSPGVQVKVVDRTTGESLKANSMGEILIKTPGLMKGYVGNEKASSAAVDADGWFHTGDLGYYNDLGQFYIVDRMKEMVKIMNMQVSPTELENEIMSIPGVVEVMVSGVTHDEDVYELLAVVVKNKNSGLTAEDIHAHIASTLSEYKKLTGGVYFVESLPRTPNGKIHRSKVRALAQSLYSGQ